MSAVHAQLRSFKVVAPHADELEIHFDQEQRPVSISPKVRDVRLHTVREVCDEYVAHRVPKLAEATRPTVKRLLKRLCDRLGNEQVSELRPAHLIRWVEGLRWNAPRSQVGRIAAAFSWAARRDLIAENPFASVEVESHEEPGRPIQDSEWRALLRAAGGKRRSRFRRLLMFAYHCGPRPIEIARIRREHVDLDRQVIVLPPEQHKTGRRTGESRQIVLTAIAARLVAWIIARMPDDQTHLFTTEEGEAWISGDGRATGLALKFRRIRDRAKLPADLCLYCLRHAYGTRLALAGVKQATIAVLMGHRGTRTTDRYVHLAGEIGHLVDAANAAAGVRLGVKRKPKPQRVRDLPGQRKLFE